MCSASFLLLVALSALCACSRSQPVLTQPPSVSVTPGQTARLPCVMGSGYSVGSYPVNWYQQRAESAPKFLLVFYSDSDKVQGTGVPNRFTGSKDPSSNTCYLTITRAQAEDDADYYCKVWHSNNAIFGGGTQLNVNTGETKAPTLSIFPPSTEEIDTNKATLVCQCQDFYPAALAWTWTVNDQTINTGVDSTRPTKQTDNNLFMAGSFLSINAIDWKANNMYTCKATHEGKTFQASVKQSECI